MLLPPPLFCSVASFERWSSACEPMLRRPACGHSVTFVPADAPRMSSGPDSAVVSSSPANGGSVTAVADPAQRMKNRQSAAIEAATPIVRLTSSPLLSPVRPLRTDCGTIRRRGRARRALSPRRDQSLLLPDQSQRLVEPELPVEALEDDGCRDVSVSPRNPVEPERLRRCLDEGDPDASVADVWPGKAQRPCAGHLLENVGVGQEVRLGAAGSLEDVGPRLDDERAEGRGRSPAVVTGYPAALATIALRVGPSGAGVVEIHLRSVVEGCKRSAHVLLSEDERAQLSRGDSAGAAAASAERKGDQTKKKNEPRAHRAEESRDQEKVTSGPSHRRVPILHEARSEATTRPQAKRPFSTTLKVCPNQAAQPTRASAGSLRQSAMSLASCFGWPAYP